MFLELARLKSDWIGLGSGGGGQFLLNCLRIQWCFLFKISFLPYRGSDLIKIIKWLPDGHHTFGPGFGPLRRSYGCNSWNFRVPELNCNCSCADPVPEPVPMTICSVLLDRRVSKSSAYQHPAGPLRSPVLVFASSKKHAGRNKITFFKTIPTSRIDCETIVFIGFEKLFSKLSYFW